MLSRLRQTAPAVALFVCFALLAIWMTGAHAHRHVGGQQHEHTQPGVAVMDHAHELEHGHSHETELLHTGVAESGTTSFAGDSDHFDPHSVSLVHEDGHENVEVQALQPPAFKSLLDLPLLALLCVAVLVLTRTRTAVVAVLTDPPDPKRADWSLRPPLRGPPSFSVV
ncbi:MAG: hypothetical protein V4709_09325 [Pseudomonadota bacterium]